MSTTPSSDGNVAHKHSFLKPPLANSPFEEWIVNMWKSSLVEEAKDRPRRSWIVSLWKGRSKAAEFRPRGAWICQLPPLALSEGRPPGGRRSACAVWFLDLKSGSPQVQPQEKSIDEYLRFLDGERKVLPGGYVFEIGMTLIAPYLESNDLYLEMSHGPLWGRADRVRWSEQGGIEVLQPLWIS